MFFNHNIIFKQKTVEESAYDLCRRYYESSNPYWRRTLDALIQKDNPNLQDFWHENADSIVKELESIFGKGNVACQKILCFICISPYMLVDYANSTISFPIYNPVKENINYFIAFMIKYTILDNLWNEDCIKVNLGYSKDSAYWIMSDFVADAICYYSALPCFAIKPAFPLYYSLIIKGDNVINMFRRLYKTMPIIDFMKCVLKYVQTNYSVFEQFTHRL